MADEKMKSFEEDLAELEELVKKLDGDMPLDGAIKAFERGIELTKRCIAELKAEKGKLEILVDDLDNVTREFTLEK